MDAAALRQLLEDTLPLEHVVHAFGYGSGVFPQEMTNSTSTTTTTTTSTSTTPKEEAPLVDVILAVDNVRAFHQANLSKNPTHYWLPPGISSTSSFALDWIVACQAPFANTFLPRTILDDPGVLFCLAPGLKYGVVHESHLRDDLHHWKNLYIAGRLHKPTQPVIVQESLAAAQAETNLPGALAAALTLLTTNVDDDDDDIDDENNNDNDSNTRSASYAHMFETVAQLSYQGDPRNAVGAEDPHKIHKLVYSAGQLQRFHNLYQPVLEQWEQRGWVNHNNITSKGAGTTTAEMRLEWDASPAGRAAWGQAVPFYQSQRKSHSQSFRVDGQQLRNQLARTVAPAARGQALKGLVTAGPQQALKYLLRKLAKGRGG